LDVTIYSTETKPLIKQKALPKLLSYLPDSLQSKAMRYRSDQSAFHFVIGRLQLLRGLNHFGIDRELEHVAFQENGKPILPGIHFNISHSGHQVICAFSKEGLLGVDLEKIKAIDFSDFGSVFSVKEWTAIKGAEDPLRSFYWFWTRKESIIKALGWNLSYLHQIELDVTLDHFVADGQRWFLRDLEVGEEYMGAICSEEEIGEIQIVDVSF
jgi:4'-phosphopantetheinyl transferase